MDQMSQDTRGGDRWGRGGRQQGGNGTPWVSFLGPPRFWHARRIARAYPRIWSSLSGLLAHGGRFCLGGRGRGAACSGYVGCGLAVCAVLFRAGGRHPRICCRSLFSACTWCWGSALHCLVYNCRVAGIAAGRLCQRVQPPPTIGDGLPSQWFSGQRRGGTPVLPVVGVVCPQAHVASPCSLAPWHARHCVQQGIFCPRAAHLCCNPDAHACTERMHCIATPRSAWHCRCVQRSCSMTRASRE